MKIKNLLFIIASMLVASCSNDSDFFPSFSDDCDWRTTIDEIITDNDQLFEGRGIKITSMRFVNDMRIDRNLFFGDEYGSFPVYSKKDSLFTVVTYNELIRDSNNYSFDTVTVIKAINKLLEDADDYDVVELTWLYENNTYNSLAFFNRRTGELEYDNMLYNMSTISRYEREGFSRTIAGTEIQSAVGASGTDYVEYRKYNVLFASAGINWAVNGEWHHILYDVAFADTFYYYFNATSTFTISNVTFQVFKYAAVGYHTFIDSIDHSVSGSSTYNLRYAIWAGPEGGLDFTQNGFHNSYSINEAPSTFASRISAGEGRLVNKNEMIYGKVELVPVPKK